MLPGIDVSTYQGVIDFAELAKSGKVSFCYAKATEGTSYVDDKFVINHHGCKANAIPFGCYHFFHFGQDPKGQALHFLKTTAGYSGQLIPMVDVEQTDGQQDLLEMIRSLGQFNDIVEKQFGCKILVYTDYGFWTGDKDASGNRVGMANTDAFCGHPLWLAQTVNPNEGLYGGWTTWAIWQYGQGQVRGIGCAVDLDVLNSDDLQAIRLP